MIRKCFTVNPNRTKNEILEYEKCLEKGVYVGCEFFYPYNKDEEHKKIYWTEERASNHPYRAYKMNTEIIIKRKPEPFLREYGIELSPWITIPIHKNTLQKFIEEIMIKTTDKEIISEH